MSEEKEIEGAEEHEKHTLSKSKPGPTPNDGLPVPPLDPPPNKP